MSALTIILAAGILVPAIGAEEVSGEVERSPKPLALQGKWKGTMRNYYGLCAKVELSGGRLKSEDKTMPAKFAADVPVLFIDEGHGRFRLNLDGNVYLGIYRQEGNRFIACFSDKHRPSEFKLTERRGLLTLHQVRHGQ